MLFGQFSNPHGENIWFGDFSAYYNAVKLYLSGEDIYGNTGFFYPPLSLLLFLPIGYLSFEQACSLMAIFNVFMLISITLLISRILQYYGILLSKTEVSLIFVATFLFYPISTSFTAGQINILILFLITLFYYCLFVKEKKTIASIFLSIATIIKLWPFVLMLLNFVAQKTRGLFARYCLAFGTLFFISLALFGTSMHIDFLNKLMDFQSISLRMHDEVLHPTDALDTNASLSNSIFKLLSIFGASNFYLSQLLSGLKLIFIFLVLYYLHKLSIEKFSSRYEWDILTFTSLIILVFIASNITWIYYGSFLVLSYMLLIFVIKLNIVEKNLLMGSIALFSAQQYVVSLSNMLGGTIQTMVYIASPSTYAYLLFLFLIFYMIKRRKERRS